MKNKMRLAPVVFLFSASAFASTWSGLGGDTNWSTAGNWDTVPSGTVALAFGGTSGLSNNNDISGVTASSLTWNAGAGAFTIGGNSLTIGSGAIIANNSSNVQTVAAPLAYAGNATFSGAGDIHLSGAYSGASTVLFKSGAGTLDLSGTGSLNAIVVGNVANAGTLTFSGGAFTQTGASQSFGSLAVGSFGTGVFNVTGGTHAFTYDANAGYGNSTGNGSINVSNTGTLTIGNGGTTASINLGGSGSTGNLTLSGSSVTNVDRRILAYGGTSTFTIQGNAQLNFAASGTNVAGNMVGGFQVAQGANTFNFDGGTVSLYGIETNYSQNTSTLNFNGTQFKLNASSANFNDVVTSSAVWNVKSGGLLIDTNGYNTALNAKLDSGSVGSLVKSGAGTLTLANAMVGFTGGIAVTGGTLNLNLASGGIFGSGTSGGGITVSGTGTLLFSQNDTFGAGGSTGGAVTANSGGTITSVSGKYTTLSTLTLNGGTLTTQNGATATFQSFAVTSGVVATGNSTINTAGSTNTALQLGMSAGTQATFQVTGTSDVLTVSAILANNYNGTGGLTKVGAGVLVLTGANTYTGGTTLNAGTIVTGNTTALGAGAVSVTAGTLVIGDTNVNTVTLASGKNLALAGASSFLKLGAYNAASLDAAGGTNGIITLAGGGTYAFTSSAGLDLNGILNGKSLGAHTYNLITGGSTVGELLVGNITGYDATVTNLSFANGVLSFTAVPEPGAYGLLAAGTLAALSFVRRRRRKV